MIVLPLVFLGVLISYQNVSTDVSALFTAVSAFAALIAAIASFMSSRATQRASEAQLFNDFIKEYGAQEIRDALRSLRQWQEENGADFATKFVEAVQNGNAHALEVDKDRRLIWNFFWKAYMLYSSKYISGKTLKQIGSVSGINLFYDIVVPIMEALDPLRYEITISPMIKAMKKICPHQETDVAFIPPNPE